jgi:hypothetical protein
LTSRPNGGDQAATVLPSRAGNVSAENKNMLPQQPTARKIIERSQASSFANRAQLSVVDLTQQPTPSTTIEPQAPSFENRAQLSLVQRPPTVLALRGGIRYLVADYWVERENLNLDYIIVGGGSAENVPLSVLDIAMTERINTQRGVPFLLTVRGR